MIALLASGVPVLERGAHELAASARVRAAQAAR